MDVTFSGSAANTLASRSDLVKQYSLISKGTTFVGRFLLAHLDLVSCKNQDHLSLFSQLQIRKDPSRQHHGYSDLQRTAEAADLTTNNSSVGSTLRPAELSKLQQLANSASDHSKTGHAISSSPVGSMDHRASNVLTTKDKSGKPDIEVKTAAQTPVQTPGAKSAANQAPATQGAATTVTPAAAAAPQSTTPSVLAVVAAPEASPVSTAASKPHSVPAASNAYGKRSIPNSSQPQVVSAPVDNAKAAVSTAVSTSIDTSIETRAQAVAPPITREGNPIKPDVYAVPDDLKVGDVVECRYKSGYDWFPGRVSEVLRSDRVDSSGKTRILYSVAYDDGERESACVRRRLRRLGEKPIIDGSVPLPVGLDVDASCDLAVRAGLADEQSNCLPGCIVSGPRRLEGGKKETYEVLFDLTESGLAEDIPPELRKGVKEGKVKETVQREQIFFMHGLIPTTVSKASVLNPEISADMASRAKISQTGPAQPVVEPKAVPVKGHTPGKLSTTPPMSLSSLGTQAMEGKEAMITSSTVASPASHSGVGLTIAPVHENSPVKSSTTLLLSTSSGEVGSREGKEAAAPNASTTAAASAANGGVEPKKMSVSNNTPVQPSALPPASTSIGAAESPTVKEETSGIRATKATTRASHPEVASMAVHVNENTPIKKSMTPPLSTSAGADTVPMAKAVAAPTSDTAAAGGQGPVATTATKHDPQKIESGVKSVQPANHHSNDQQAAKIGSTTPSPLKETDQLEASRRLNLDDLKVGDVVECRYMSGHEWFPGKIADVHRTSIDGGGNSILYSVDYDDGEKESDCVRRRLRRRGEKPTYENSVPLPIGLEVDAPCELVVQAQVLDRRTNCLPGRVVSGPRLTDGNKKDVYDVEFDLAEYGLASEIPAELQNGMIKGKVVEAVESRRILTLHGSMATSVSKSAGAGEGPRDVVGMQLGALHEGQAKVQLNAGVAVSKPSTSLPTSTDAAESPPHNSSGGDDSMYVKETGSHMKSASPQAAIHHDDLVKAHSATSTVSDMGSGAEAVASGSRAAGNKMPAEVNLVPDDLSAGDVVECRFMTGHDWYPGVIAEVRRGDKVGPGGKTTVLYSVDYEDGEQEFECVRRKLRRHGEKPVFDTTVPLPVGLDVDAPCDLVVQARLVDGASNRLPGRIVSGPRSEGKKKELYEIQFDLVESGLADDIPAKLRKGMREGKVVETVERGLIFTLYGR
jgi:hypothetical protein